MKRGQLHIITIFYALENCQSSADPLRWPEGHWENIKRHRKPYWLIPGWASWLQSPWLLLLFYFFALWLTKTKNLWAQSLKKHLTCICIANPCHVITKVLTVFKEDMMESGKAWMLFEDAACSPGKKKKKAVMAVDLSLLTSFQRNCRGPVVFGIVGFSNVCMFGA